MWNKAKYAMWVFDLAGGGFTIVYLLMHYLRQVVYKINL